jgi:glycosyltransferase involved in cell wall biosynthesis
MSKADKPRKVVIIDTFNPDKPDHHPGPTEDLYYIASWGGQWARNLKKNYPDLDLEIWRPEPSFDEIKSRIAFGVRASIFPAKKFVISKTVTTAMLKRLWSYSKKHQLIIHRNTIFDWRFNILLPCLLPSARFILSHHGGTFPTKKSIKSLIKEKILCVSFKRISAITYLRAAIKETIERSNRKIWFTFLPVGANFGHFRPLDKQKCREKLNLPLDSVLAVYVGKYYSLKGVDHILSVYHLLKNRNFGILFVGGSEADELYSSVAASGCRIWDYMDHDRLREVYSAADFYIHPAFHPSFGGFDVSLIEALACNRPVLSPQLRELDFNYCELGLPIDDDKEILEKTKTMIKKYGDYTRCRESAIGHLDRDSVILEKLLQIYMGV